MSTVGYVLDSNSQVTREVIETLAVPVDIVPITVRLGAQDHLEGVDLDSDRFYEALAVDDPPAVSTAAPSPGRLLAAYERLADAGVDEVISLHVSAAHSGTVGVARLAARRSPVPVHVVDSRLASFGISLLALRLEELRLGGTPVHQLADDVPALAGSIHSVFVLAGTELAEAGGRFGDTLEGATAPVLASVGDDVSLIGEAASAAEAIELMVGRVAAAASRSDVIAAVGLADRATQLVTDDFAAALEGCPGVVEVLRYRVGPSVGAHTGPGTLGGFYCPTP